MVVKQCIRCPFKGHEKYFVKGRNHCKKCHNKAERESYQTYKDERSVLKKEYNKTYLKRPEVIERIKTYKQCDEYKEYCRKYARERVQNNLEERIKTNIRNRIRHSVKEHNECSAELIGCPINVLIEWLEYNFDENMSWDNYGSYWHMDHIRPCNSFDMTNKKDRLQCFNWKNIAPLEARENESKHCRVDYDTIEFYKERIESFVDYYIDEHEL